MIKICRPFKNKTSLEIINSLFVLNTCGIPGIAHAAPVFLKTSKLLGTEKITNAVIKKTFFKTFCGGENLSQVGSSIDSFRLNNVKSILDVAVEEKKNNIIRMIIDSINTAKRQTDNFIAIKLSSIMSEKEIMSGNYNYMDLDKICNHAFKSKVMVMIDAENSLIQRHVDKIAIYLANKWNFLDTVVWNTYQMYLLDSFPRLQRDIYNKKTKMGIKLVRGAYYDSEPFGILHKSIQDTHLNYNNSIKFCTEKIKSNVDIKVMIATHNKESVLLAKKEISSHKVLRENIMFGQLLGMKDNITFELSEENYKVYKYIPYGPVDTVLPYLVRRAQENSSVLKNGEDIRLLLEELIYRFLKN